MKTLLRITAGLAFLFPFIAGVGLLNVAFSSTYQDGLLAGAIGAFLVGNAIFVGAILLFAAEKLNRNLGREL
jgi:hypothetical protein